MKKIAKRLTLKRDVLFILLGILLICDFRMNLTWFESQTLRRLRGSFGLQLFGGVEIPEWINLLGIRATFIKLWREANIPQENIAIGLRYELLNKYDKYYQLYDEVMGKICTPEERIKGIINAFIYETRFLLLLNEIFSSPEFNMSPEEITNLLDLGIAGWPYIHLLASYFKNAQKIVGVEKHHDKAAEAMANIGFWELDKTKILPIEGDFTWLDLFPATEENFQLITLFHQAILPIVGDYNYEQTQCLFEGIKKRLSEGKFPDKNGILVISTPTNLWVYYYLTERVFSLVGAKKLIVPAVPFDAMHMTRLNYLRNLFSSDFLEKNDTVFIISRDAVEKIEGIFANLVLVQLEFNKDAADKLFKLKLKDQDRYVGIEILAQETLQDTLLNILRFHNLSSENEWDKVAQEILKLLK